MHSTMALGAELTAFLGRILASESALRVTFAKGDEVAFVAESLLVSFLLSFVSRAPSRERQGSNLRLLACSFR